MVDNHVISDFIISNRKAQKHVQEMAMELCRDILKEQENKCVVFCEDGDEESNMPCTNYNQSSCSDDVVSADVKKVWLDEENGIHATLWYYYQGESDDDCFLEETNNEFDWLELLDWLNQL